MGRPKNQTSTPINSVETSNPLTLSHVVVSYQFDHKVFFGCLLSSYMVMPILHILRSVWISKDSFLFFLFKILCVSVYSKQAVYLKQWLARAMSQRHSKTFDKPPIRNFLEVF